MDFGLSETQQMLQRSAREFLETECAPEHVRDMEEDERGYTLEMWEKLVEQGWPGLVVPEAYGRRRYELPGPLHPAGGDGPGAAAGALLLDRGSGRYGRLGRWKPSPAAEAPLRYRRRSYDDDARADRAERSVGPGRRGDRRSRRGRGIPDYRDEALRAQRPHSRLHDRGRQDRRRRGLRRPVHRPQGLPGDVPDSSEDRLLRQAVRGRFRPRSRAVQRRPGRSSHGGWPTIERVLQWGAVGKCAEMVGGARRVLEMTVEYAKRRVQFGRPVGSFQAVQHHCANMALDVEACRDITYQAAWRLSEGLPAAMDVAMAKSWVSDAYARVCALAHQCHGAIGFTKEHDLQLYTRRAKAAEVAFGDGEHHRQVVAAEMGLYERDAGALRG